MDDDTAKWLRSIDDTLANKLADVGLTHHRQTAMLGKFIADYIEQQSPTVKPATRTTWKQCQRLLLEHFGENTPIRTITEGHAIGWRTHLLTRHNSRVKSRRKLSESTIRNASAAPGNSSSMPCGCV